MNIEQITSPEALEQYDTFIQQHSNGSLWQSLQWKKIQEALGREVRIYAGYENDEIIVSALVVIDRTVGGWSTWEMPYGPLVNISISQYLNISIHAVMREFVCNIAEKAKKEKCFCMYLNPPQENTYVQQLQESGRYVHPEANIVVDLQQSEEEILKQMKPKGRYNIKVAQKHGVQIEQSTHAEAFADLHKKTAQRDAFRSPSAKMYRAMLEHIDDSFLLLAYSPDPDSDQNPSPRPRPRPKSQSQPIAGLLGVLWNNIAIYYYGASDHAYRALMAPYLLQWEAMRHSKEHGCQWYSMFGVAPNDNPEHPWRGITQFKEKFGGQYVEYPSERMIVLNRWVKMGIEWKRRIAG